MPALRCHLCAQLAASVLMLLPIVMLSAADRKATVDPATWGSDHVGKPVPEFVSGDQCLFCHRRDVGPVWPDNRHGLTIRVASGNSAAEKALVANPQLKDYAAEVEYLLGTGQHRRLLKRGERSGRLDVLSVTWANAHAKEAGRLSSADDPHWNTKLFGDACAGCHATGVDASTRQFSAISLDCFVCHGNPPDEHTEHPALVRLSPRRETSAREIMSICGQCHLRGGRSKSTGLPYPNNFVAGDNLFRDFKADLSDEALRQLNPADGHIFANVRDVVRHGRDDMTCLSCHDVHQQSTARHQLLDDNNLCLHCHHKDGRKDEVKTYQTHSTTCRY